MMAQKNLLQKPCEADCYVRASQSGIAASPAETKSYCKTLQFRNDNSFSNMIDMEMETTYALPIVTQLTNKTGKLVLMSLSNTFLFFNPHLFAKKGTKNVDVANLALKKTTERVLQQINKAS